MFEELVNRFEPRTVITVDGCWLYEGFHNPKGYPRVYWRGRQVSLHRLSVAETEGLDYDSADWQALHRNECGNPGCWNPDHLYAGDNYDNMRDLYGVLVKDRQREVDALLDAGVGTSEIARRLGVSRSGVSMYKHRHTALARGGGSDF